MIGQARSALADALAGVMRTHGSIPGRLTPPAAVVMAGSPFVEDGDTFGSLKVRFDVSIIAGTATNETTTTQLDNLIDNAIMAALQAGYALENVSEFKVYPANNAEYAAVDMTVTIDVEMEK